jgi:Lar family restriction alleviation protein
MLREILEELLNKYRVVKTDEDLEWNRAVDMCRNIIEKHINDGKGTNVPTKDGWISVEERLPKEHLTMLKNCPFCGGKAVVHINEGVRVVCRECGATSKCLVDGYSKGKPNGSTLETVIKAWNRRTQ